MKKTSTTTQKVVDYLWLLACIGLIATLFVPTIPWPVGFYCLLLVVVFREYDAELNPQEEEIQDIFLPPADEDAYLAELASTATTSNGEEDWRNLRDGIDAIYPTEPDPQKAKPQTPFRDLSVRQKVFRIVGILVVAALFSWRIIYEIITAT